MADTFDDATVEPTITIGEYLKEVEDEELEADLVLGGDEGKECTYNMGYMKRQAIFSCLTCTPDGNAGVCTACSLSCHDGHEIVELWTKRNFRCDCGNSKFGEFFCKLFPSKDVENTENSYNHNFKGLYCTCCRPYPDPELEEQEEMIQCIICEDWFHEEHLGLESSNEIPKDEEGEPLYEDFICKACSELCSFLTLYSPTVFAARAPDVVNAALTSKGKSVIVEEADKLTENQLAFGTEELLENDTCSHASVGNDDCTVNKNCESVQVIENDINLIQCNKDGKINPNCALGENRVVDSTVIASKPLFLSKNWRERLCKCEKCVDMYKQKNVSYLTEKEDSIAEYEKIAKQKREEKLQQAEVEGLNFLNNLGHVEKMEVINGINDFKDEFRSFLESYDPSKPITPSDVQQIFANLANKRRRAE